MQRIKPIYATLLTLVLSACGGGGGGDPPPLRGPLAITAANAEVVTAVTIEGLDDAIAAGEVLPGIDPLATGVVIEAPLDGGSPALRALAWAREAKREFDPSSGDTAVGVVVRESVPCTLGGSLTLEIDTGVLTEEAYIDLILAGIQPGDTSDKLIFANCSEPGVATINGSVQLTYLNSFPLFAEFGIDDFTVDVLILFDNLEVVGESLLDGDQHALFDSDPGGVLDLEVSGSSLATVTGSRTTTVRDYFSTHFEDGLGFVVTTLEATVDDSRLDGTITVDTPLPLVAEAAADWPHSGSLRMVGAGGTGVILNALDGTNVQLAVDVSGDGVTDLTLDTTWIALDALNAP